MMRIGLLGGTFDPIHVGHLDVARAAHRAVPLERVVLLPSNVPPHRSAPRTSAAHRFAMTSLAAQEIDWLVVSDLDMHTDGPAYTAGTLQRLSDAGVDTRTMFFLTGADAFRDIRSWREYPAILDRCHFVVVSRPGCPAGSLRTVLPELAPRMRELPCAIPAEPGIFLLEAPTSPVSSTDVRHRISSGSPIDGLVPEPVAAHIRKHGLYSADPLKGFE